MIGTTVSHYRILEKLGQGGMGIVYKAEDLTLRRTVALKFLPPHVAASETDRARFLLEAQAAAALNHPNICTIYGIEETDGHSFIAMEFVDGQTLREKRSSINLAKAIDVGIQIAEGLGVAHEKGIVHRDIKPENIMVRKDGIVQIMDFGLAKLRASRASRLTKEGSTVGTAGFMSPEQVQGQETDHRSDIFSLGVLLYELFTGELPFKGVHETALLYEIVNVDPAPMSSVRPEIDPELDRIVLECLQKEPDERYQGVKDISKDLKRFKRESSKQRVSRTIPALRASGAVPGAAPVAAPSPAAAARLLWPALCALLALAAMLLAWAPWRSAERPDAPTLRVPLQLPANSTLANGSTAIAIAPQGDRFVYLASVSGVPQLFLRYLDRFEAVQVQGTDGALDPFFSPDGQWIGFFAGGKLLKVSVSGGAPVEIAAVKGYPRGGWWDADGRIWFGNINQSIFRVGASGGEIVEVTALDTTKREISHRFPCLLPDKKTIIYTIKQNNITTFDDAIIAAENTETHERTVLVRGGSCARYLAAGYLVYTRGDMIYAAPFDAGTLTLTGDALPVTRGGMMNPYSGIANFSAADNGVLLYSPLGAVGDGKQTLSWLTPGGATSPLLDTVRQYGYLNLSPDGERLAMTLRAANDDIWVYHIGRGTLTRLTFGGGNSDLPVWSPDGRNIVYGSERGGTYVYLLKPWDGSAAERPLAPGLEADAASPPSFSPDGRLLLCSSRGDIWSVPVDGSAQPTRVLSSPASETWPSLSPDGRFLAYASDESGRQEVYVVSFPVGGGKWQVSSGGGVAPSWSPDGRALLFGAGSSIMRTPVSLTAGFDFSAAKKAYDLPSSWNGQSLALLRDGSKGIIALAQATEIPATQINIATGWLQDVRRALSHGKAD